jgi:hypothetical protein
MADAALQQPNEQDLRPSPPREQKMRRKIAVVATAQRLLVIRWGMLLDGTTWRERAITAVG